MHWFEQIFVLIDMRSFSNLWYWIMLAVVWSTASHWVMGVPYDLITRARRDDPRAAEQLALLARIKADRLLFISRSAGLWMLGLTAFLLSALLMLATLYRVEFAQALFLLLAPLSLVSLLTLRLAVRVEREDPPVDLLAGWLMRHRLLVQFIGMISIFVTSLFGMYRNLSLGAFG